MIYIGIAIVALMAAVYRTSYRYYLSHPEKLAAEIDWLKMASGVSGVMPPRNYK